MLKLKDFIELVKMMNKLSTANFCLQFMSPSPICPVYSPKVMNNDRTCDCCQKGLNRVCWGNPQINATVHNCLA